LGRILAVDYGVKRTGLAVTDPLQIIAGSLETVETAQLSVWLKQYVGRELVERIIVGVPLHLDGSVSKTMKQHVLPFIQQLRKDFPEVDIVPVDERFTSKMAVRAMTEGGMKKKDRAVRGNVDKLSATILLQGYLEQLKHGKRKSPPDDLG
jgi:putative Holliday junction resolvase